MTSAVYHGCKATFQINKEIGKAKNLMILLLWEQSDLDVQCLPNLSVRKLRKSVSIFLQDNNLERAADWVFSHSAELDAPMETEDAGASGEGPQYRDGNGSKLTHCLS